MAFLISNDLCSTDEAALKLYEAGVNKANFGCEHLRDNRGQVYWKRRLFSFHLQLIM